MTTTLPRSLNETGTGGGCWPTMPSTRLTGCRTVTDGPPGISLPRPSAVPLPHPDWLVTDLGATDTELGVLKTGKEADVFLLRRGVPGTDRSCLLAAKRYRSAEHRQFHRDGEYLDGRRVRESRDNRAMAKQDRGRPGDDRPAVGRGRVRRALPAASGRGSGALPGADHRHRAAARVHRRATTAPPRRGWPRLRPSRRRAGRASGTSSSARCARSRGSAWCTATCPPTTCSCTRAALVLIDLPQVIDVIAHPRGAEFLERDVANVSRWFAARGLDGVATPPDELGRAARAEAGL